MEDRIRLSYFYGKEADQFSFYKIPKLLFTEEYFKKISVEAKVLYGLMLDRMSLSMKNQWMDDEGRAYIYYSLEDIMEALGCSNKKAISIMKELDTDAGIGLIEKKRQGQGKPTMIYLKQFMVQDVQKCRNFTSEQKAAVSEVKNLHVFRTDDMLDDKLLEPLNNGQLMISPRVKDSAKELCEQLIDIYMAENDETESKITAQIKTKIILLQFILEMWKKGFVIENDTSGRNIVEKEMVSYIQQNFTGKISLKEFGKQFHLSEKYISRYFKEHFHITLSQYITYLRLENAKQLLQDTDFSVTETAMQSGYQNVSYFIRSFKKTYGISPLKYRNSGILTKI